MEAAWGGAGVVSTSTVPPVAIHSNASMSAVESYAVSEVSQIANRIEKTSPPVTGAWVWSHVVAPAVLPQLPSKPLPASSAVPPTRMRSPSRVTATLCVSSMMVDSGAPAGSVMGTVME